MCFVDCWLLFCMFSPVDMLISECFWQIVTGQPKYEEKRSSHGRGRVVFVLQWFCGNVGHHAQYVAQHFPNFAQHVRTKRRASEMPRNICGSFQTLSSFFLGGGLASNQDFQKLFCAILDLGASSKTTLQALLVRSRRCPA